jgi:hypothetical protein
MRVIFECKFLGCYNVVARISLIGNFERNYTREFNLPLEVVVLPWIW